MAKHPHYSDEELQGIIDRLEALKEKLPVPWWKRAALRLGKALYWVIAFVLWLLFMLALANSD